MENTERIQYLKWFLERSDNLRGGYSTKAAIVISANTIIAATAIFYLEKYDKLLSNSSILLNKFVFLIISVSLFYMVRSFYHAIRATGSLDTLSRQFTGFIGPPRFFLNPSETLYILKDVSEFHKKGVRISTNRIKKAEEVTNLAKSFSEKDILESISGELYVALFLQNFRYGHLKKSFNDILISFLSLMAAHSIFIFFIILKA